MIDDLMTTQEAASYLKIGVVTIQRWHREGFIPSVKIGKAIRIRRSDLDRWYAGMLAARG